MQVLSFETATYFGGVGLIDADATATAGPFPARGASREILPAARAILDARGLSLGDLDVVAVSNGPGLFTGVRVGLALAKTIAWAARDRSPAIVAVGTLRAVARLPLSAGLAEIGHLIAAVTDARRGEVYAALFEVVDAPRDDGMGPALRRIGEDIVVRPERAAERLFAARGAPAKKQRPICLVGDGFKRYGPAAALPFGPEATLYPFAEGNLPLEVARLGARRYGAGTRQTPDDVEPHYVRRPDARPPALGFLSPTAPE